MKIISSEIPLEILLSVTYLVPISFFRYVPFKDKFRFSTKITILLYFSFFTFVNLILVLLGRYDTFIISNRSRVFLYFGMTLFSFYLIKDHIGKQLYIICFYANYSLLFSAAPLIPEAMIYGRTSSNLSLKLIGMVIILLIAMPLIYHYSFKPLSAIVKRDIPKLWYILWLVGLVQLLLNAALSVPYHSEDIWVSRSAVIRLSISIGSILLNHTILYLINGMLRANDKSIALMAEKQQLLIQEYQYRKIKEQIEYSRRFRHDFKHHGGLITSILKDTTLTEHDKLEKLTKYCDEYFNSIPSAEELLFCEHYSLNLMLNYYANNAKNAGIHTDFKIDMPASIPMKDTELCVIIGNLLLNAIEGATTAPESLKYITLTVSKNGRNLLIAVENGFDGQISQTGEIFHSTKHPDPGIGITNIRNIAARYDGNCYFEPNGKMFSARIHLILEY